MNRQSVASSRASQLPGNSAPNPAALSRLLEKKKEFEAVSALEHSSALFLKRIEGITEDCQTMAAAGIVHGQVLAQWPQMFRILNMLLSSRQQVPGSDADQDAAEPASERLVRVPIEELQTAARPSG